MIGKTQCTVSPFIDELDRSTLVHLRKLKRDLPTKKRVSDEPSQNADADADAALEPDADAALEPPNRSDADAPSRSALLPPSATAPEDQEEEWMATLSKAARGMLTRLALKWGAQKSFAEPTRLVTKIRAVVERTLCTCSVSTAQIARKPVLRELKVALKHPRALEFAATLLRDIEAACPFLNTSKPASGNKWAQKGVVCAGFE